MWVPRDSTALLFVSSSLRPSFSATPRKTTDYFCRVVVVAESDSSRVFFFVFLFFYVSFNWVHLFEVSKQRANIQMFFFRCLLLFPTFVRGATWYWRVNLLKGKVSGFQNVLFNLGVVYLVFFVILISPEIRYGYVREQLYEELFPIKKINCVV